MSRLSVNEMTTYRWSFDEDVQHYLAAGFEGIGVWREKLADYGEARGCKLLAESGLTVSSLQWAGGFTGSDGRPHTEAIDDAFEAVELAAKLQAGCLLVHSGARAGHTQKHARRLLQMAINKILPYAETMNVVLALEPMHPGCAGGWTFLTDFSEALAFVHDYDSPHLKLTFDSYHLTHDVAILEQLSSIVPDIGMVQVGDARRAPRGEQCRCRLGEGILPLSRVVNRFMESGYRGYFEVELLGEEIETDDYHELLQHSRQTLDDLLASSQSL
jgi:sugar phosphate isomerase/epimerase